jgi:cell division protein FtsA
VVLTGGGALMDGIQELAEKVFEMPVKIGVPTGFGGLTEAAKSPVHATGVGLCIYGVLHGKAKKGRKSSSTDDNFKKIFDKMKAWVKEFF